MQKEMMEKTYWIVGAKATVEGEAVNGVFQGSTFALNELLSNAYEYDKLAVAMANQVCNSDEIWTDQRIARCFKDNLTALSERKKYWSNEYNRLLRASC